MTHLYMSLNLCPKLLQVLNNGAVDGPSKIRMLVCDDTRLVANAIVDILTGISC